MLVEQLNMGGFLQKTLKLSLTQFRFIPQPLLSVKLSQLRRLDTCYIQRGGK